MLATAIEKELPSLSMASLLILHGHFVATAREDNYFIDAYEWLGISIYVSIEMNRRFPLTQGSP